VIIIKNEPSRYGKHGELLIDYEHMEEHAIRSHGVVSANGGKPVSRAVDHVNHPDTESGESLTYEKRETV
jgi:hypothetical protein